jgi:hypothetical protein
VLQTRKATSFFTNTMKLITRLIRLEFLALFALFVLVLGEAHGQTASQGGMIQGVVKDTRGASTCS